MGDKDTERWMKKSKLASAYETIPSPELRRAIAVEYGKLLRENDLSDPMLAGHLRSSILPAVAVYRCLQGYGYTQSASLAVIRAAVLEAAQPMANFFQRLGRLPFFFPLFRILCPISTKHSFDGYLSGNGMMRMQSNGTVTPTCMSMCFTDTVCRSWRPSSAKVMM